ncbi:hypothetical protein [Thermoactinomyces mirandus]|uniref:hypothetical protein n=1 Tax=Thermoactinomyces mirandus TaxID=2756294 RepID=UPI0015EE86F0|nr:hypothetical protein [Thermoactinomyces mirandus]
MDVYGEVLIMMPVDLSPNIGLLIDSGNDHTLSLRKMSIVYWIGRNEEHKKHRIA